MLSVCPIWQLYDIRETLNIQDGKTKQIQPEFLSFSLEENHSAEWTLHKREINLNHVKSLRFWGCLLQNLALLTLTNVGTFTLGYGNLQSSNLVLLTLGAKCKV